MAADNTALSKAQAAATTPYQAYSGELTAGVNGQESNAINATNSLGATTSGYLNSANGLANASTAAVNPSALDGAAISQFSNPYQSQVINATQAQMAQQDAVQNAQQTSQAIGAGSFGGDRAGVAQAALAGQQALANNTTLANLNSSNYSQALSAAQGQQSLGLAANQANRSALATGAQLQAGLGNTASSTGIANANAQMQGGLLQQQTAQAGDTANYGQFEQEQAFPYQQSNFLTSATAAIAPSMGTTTNGTQQQAAPSIFNSLVGGGLGLLGFLNKADGGAVVGLEGGAQRARGGRTLGDIMMPETRRMLERGTGLGSVRHFASGGLAGAMSSTPYGDASGYIPNTGLLGAARAPQASGGIGASSSGLAGAALANGFDMNSNLMQGAKLYIGSNSIGSDPGDAARDWAQDNLGLARGGKVISLADLRMKRGYDDGGVVSPDALMFDPSAVGANSTFNPGLAGAALPNTLQPPNSGLAGAAMTPSDMRGLVGAAMASVPQAANTGLAGAALPSQDNTPPVMQPSPHAMAYTGGNGLGLAGAALPASPDLVPATGLGLAAINNASPPSTDPMGGYMGRVATIESSGGKNVDNAQGSGATGPYQFMPGTWADVSTKHPDLGLTADGIHDPAQQQRAMQAFTADNSAALTQALGRQPTQGELYLAHQQGAAGAIGLLTDPNARASDIVGQAAVVQNGGSPDMTAGQFSSMWQSKFAGAKPSDLGSVMAYSGDANTDDVQTGRSASTGLAGAALPQQDNSRGGGLFSSLGDLLGHIHTGISDQARVGLMAAGAGMMASPSRNFGMAAGEGIQKGLAAYQGQQKLDSETGLARANIANLGSLVADRPVGRDIEKQNTAAKLQEIYANMKRIDLEGKNYASEDKYRQAEGAARTQDSNTTAARLQLERYEPIYGPDGGYRFIDKLNPGRGILSAADIQSTGGTPPTSGAPPVASGTPNSQAGGLAPTVSWPSSSSSTTSSAAGSVQSGAQQPVSGPASLDSSSFMKTGNPSLRAPQGYLPTNFYANQVRVMHDPVARDVAAKQTTADITEANDRAQKAYSSTFYSDEMDRNANALSNSGVLVPGGAFPERLGLAKNWNAAMTGLGLDSMQVDPNSVRAGEALVKDKTRLGAQLTQSLGSREAAAVFGSMMSAVPGADNSRSAYKSISSSIRTLAQRDIDRNAFYQDWGSRYGNTTGAEVAFNQLNPAMQYARQAQSLAKIPQQATDMLRANANNPSAISAFETQYGPGTARYFTGQLTR